MIYRNTNNAWNAPANLLYAKDNYNTWKSVKQAFVNDAGTWKNVYDGISTAYATVPLSAFWYSVAHGNGYFVMAGVKAFGSSREPVVVYSTDGVTWTQSATEFNGIPLIPAIIFAGDRFVMRFYGRLWQYTSTDGGVSWLSGATDSNQGVGDGAIYNPNNDKIFSTAYNYNTFVYVSSNKGTNWTQVATPTFNTNNPYYSGGSGMAIGNNGTMVMLANSSTSGGGSTTGYVVSAVNVSTDGGTTWSQIATPPYWSNCVVFFNNMFIVYSIAYGVQPHLRSAGMYSYDGITWNTFGGGTSLVATNYVPLQAKDRLIIVPNSSQTLFTSVCGVNTASYPVTPYAHSPALPYRTYFASHLNDTVAVDKTTGTIVFLLDVRDAVTNINVINNRVLVSKIATTTSFTDPDVLAYFANVEAADGQSLENEVKDAVNVFVLGCKQDNIWYSMSACCIMAGARTLAGALVPLKGAAPTNNNFVSADYDRRTGLKGDKSTKYLNANRAGDADPATSKHVVVHTTESMNGTGTQALFGGATSLASTMLYAGNPYTSFNYFMNQQYGAGTGTLTTVGLQGLNKPSAGVTTFLSNNVYYNTVGGVDATNSVATYLFASNSNGTAAFYCNTRMAFYSMGSSVDLYLIGNRVVNLVNALRTI